jgi:hypothetical protein
MFRENVYVHILCELTPWMRDLLEKLTVAEIVMKFPVFYGTRRFIAMFTRARR